MNNIHNSIFTTTSATGALNNLAKRMKKQIAPATMILSTIMLPSVAHAQSNTWTDVAESNLRDLKRTMTCDYVFGSARYVTVIAQDKAYGTTLLSARYDYRCGDSTSSDTVYMSFSNGGYTRTCYAYAFFSKQCTLNGQVIDR